MSEERYRRGRALLDRLEPDQGTRILAALDEIAPDFSRLLVEFAFGDICARPGLDLKTREIATVAALTALGTAPAQLRVHIKAALNLGCSRTELIETIMQMAVYAGFPAALNGLAAAREVLADRPGQVTS
jgi:4-carboxymuconolactone decarboxylase